MNTFVFGRLVTFSITATVVLAICGCEKAGITPSEITEETAEENQSPGSISAYPVTRSLKNQQGREIQAKIIGRNVATITFLRQPDGRRFTTRIDKFSDMDQRFLRNLPLAVAKANQGGGTSRSNSSGDSNFSSFIDSRNKEIDELHENTVEQQRMIRSVSPSSPKFRSAFSRIEKNKKRILELKNEISEFKRFNQ